MNPEVRTPAKRDRLTRRGFWLEYASMAWMTVEAAVAITSGIIASSIALVGFGLDSVIEFFSAAMLAVRVAVIPDGKERWASMTMSTPRGFGVPVAETTVGSSPVTVRAQCSG